MLLRLNPETHRQLTLAARTSGVSAQVFVERSIGQHLKSWARSDVPEKAKAEINRLVQRSQEIDPPRRRK